MLKTIKPKPKKVRRKMFQYNEDHLKNALFEIRENKMKIREASRRFNVPKTTIIDRLSGRVPDTLRKPGPPPLLTVEGENRIKNWVINLAKCGFPVKKRDVDRYGARNPEISLREAEGINKARAIVSEEYIRKWFEELMQFLRDNNLMNVLTDDPRRIFNGDESGFGLCPKTGKVLGPKGFKNLYSIQQGNEKENVTVLITFNADGKFAPPLVLFPYIRPPRALVDNMPSEWVLGRSEKGWTTSEVFFKYLSNDFNKWLLKENIPRPIILFVDGHKSHLTMATSEWCDQNQVILYALPPNTTHILQPADVSVFRPMKADWRKTVRLWQSRPENINSCVFNEILTDKTEFEIKVKNGFRKCGIFPLNPDAVDYTKCIVNTSERLKKTQTHVSRRSSENITQRDIRSAKKVINKIKLELQSYGINTEVILNEIDLLVTTMVSPRKSSEGNKENLVEQSSAEPMLVIETDTNDNKTQSTTLNEDEVDVTDVNTEKSEAITEKNEKLDTPETLQQSSEPLANKNEQGPLLPLSQVFDNHLTYPGPIKRSNNTNKKSMGRAPSAISSDKWREYYRKIDEEKQQKNIDIQRKKEERRRLKEDRLQNRKLSKEKRKISKMIL
ncbi:hypothetical protein NQ314_014114 [Rhamnusium bicolor]|uniref:HTH psq-type domain-containing protein n=1 Tax=Rhamnusium bicolor TaxID=1586634 RepID=A0AAV8X411_9CUCU|nr:hypothetical protein NQ314_014114 [Rhamnusium bicolor]